MWNFLFTHTPLLYLVQSFWRDEAFSVLFAQKSFTDIITLWGTEPPLYYFLLHIWMQIFGSGDIITRCFSLLGFILSVCVVILWSEKLFKKTWLSWFTPLFYFLNPMLLYYAFEVRTYGWMMFFGILSLYSFWEQKWVLYTLVTILGAYIHSYLLLVPFTQALYFLGIHRASIVGSSIKRLTAHPLFKAFFLIGITSIPLFLRAYTYVQKFKESWYFPVDFHLIKSVIGNMFLGYEGTPWYFWATTSKVSLLLLAIFAYALVKQRKTKRAISVYLSSVIFIPLITVIGISFVKPIFVNRYLLPVTIAEVLLVCVALSEIPKKRIAQGIAGIGILLVSFFSLWYAPFHTKPDIRTPVLMSSALKNSQDLILADDQIILLETYYYAADKASVRLYNPNNVPFKWYIGESVVTPSMFTEKLPEFPKKAFLIKKDGTFNVVASYPIISGRNNTIK